MVRNIIKGKKIFGRKAKPATEADQEIVTDLLRYIACQSRNMRWNGGKYDLALINRSLLWQWDHFSLQWFNPVITKMSGEYKTEEGCLSLEGTRLCTRYEEIEVDYLDSNFQFCHGKYSGWTAQIIQHEIDHCKGIVI